MRIKTIVFAFGALLIFGMGWLAVETWAEVQLDVTAVYEVTMPAEMAAQLPDNLSNNAVLIMLEMGWLRPEDPEQLGAVEGQYCHLVVSSCGPNCWLTRCPLGRGFVNCPCWHSIDPSVQ